MENQASQLENIRRFYGDGVVFAAVERCIVGTSGSQCEVCFCRGCGLQALEDDSARSLEQRYFWRKYESGLK